MNTQSQPTIALLHWGNIMEEFLDTIGVSFESFCNEWVGSWMFGYIDALRVAGVRTVLICMSDRVTAPLRRTHKPTGAAICMLPVPILYRIARRPELNRLLFNSPMEDIAPYVSTNLWLLSQELRREGCQAILCQEYEYPRFDACVLLGRLMRLPVFASFQGGDSYTSRLEKFIRPTTLQASSGLIIATQTEVKRVEETYGISDTKVSRIFNPLNISDWYPVDRIEARNALGIPIDAQVVVYHGRIQIHRKGLDVLMEAWKQLCRERASHNLQLLLVGTGSDTNKLRDLIEALQLQNVIWVDEFVNDRARMRQYLSAADVYTLPSRHEGFPVAPLEAMACGLPVVAADAPGVPDILEGGEVSGGLVVPRENPTALAKALGRVLDDEAWGRELGKRARCRVQEYFSLEAIGKQLHDLLLSQSSQGRM
jgi:starch synthase